MIINNICCIGAGYVGGPTMAVIADRCRHIKVNIVDINSDRINSWNKVDLNQLPVFEPGLKDIILRTRNRNLFFSTNIEEHISRADLIFISVNTPIKQSGVGAGMAVNLQYIELCSRQIAKFAKGHTIIVEKSTLPVRTAQTIKTILNAEVKSLSKNNDLKSFSILSNPEFLSEGSAINDLEEPDRVLIGGEDKDAIQKLVEIYKNWVPSDRIITTNLWSSELSKLIANAFLAQRVSSINSVASLCEATGANVEEVSLAVGADSRLGNKFLKPGPGFGGSCFKKDILNLVYLCNHFGLPEVGSYWENVLKLNNWHKEKIVKTIVNKLFGTLTNKKIVILGFAFKANTNDTRESPAIFIVDQLLKEGANLIIHDPKVNEEQIENDLSFLNRKNYIKKNYSKSQDDKGSWTYTTKLDNVFENAHAIVILTEWNEYSILDWKRISNQILNTAWIFDTRGLLNQNNLEGLNANVWKIGNS